MLKYSISRRWIMDLKIVKEEIKKNMIERNISTEQLAKILDIKIRS